MHWQSIIYLSLYEKIGGSIEAEKIPNVGFIISILLCLTPLIEAQFSFLEGYMTLFLVI